MASDFSIGIAYLASMTVLLASAQKWAGMDPRRIQDGPSWFWASLSALYTMTLFVTAMVFETTDRSQATAFVGSFAFGSAIGACFLTEFKPAPEDVPSFLVRWWMSRLSTFADMSFKSIIVIAGGAIVTWVTHIDGRYWTAVCLAFGLVTFKAGDALVCLQPFNLSGKARGPGQTLSTQIETYIGDLVVLYRKGKAAEAVSRLRDLMEKLKLSDSEKQTAEVEFQLYATRRRMLIGGNLIVTMIVGLSGLAGWLTMARPIMITWGRYDYLGMLGFFAGVVLHVR